MNFPKWLICVKPSKVTVSNNWNTPANWVTTAGFPLAVCYAYFATTGHFWLAILMLLLMSATELGDGMVVRYTGKHSRVGKILDWMRDWWYQIFLPFPLCFFIPELASPYFFIVIFSTLTLTYTKQTAFSDSCGGKNHTVQKCLLHSLILIMVLILTLMAWKIQTPVLFIAPLAGFMCLIYVTAWIRAIT